MKLPLFYGRFPHFPHYFPHFPYIIGYARLAKLLYETLLFGCKLNIILNGKWTSFRWCGWHLKSDLMQDVRAWGWRAAIKPESDAGHTSLRLADNDKISRKGHRTALRCCRCPFYFAKEMMPTRPWFFHEWVSIVLLIKIFRQAVIQNHRVLRFDMYTLFFQERSRTLVCTVVTAAFFKSRAA